MAELETGADVSRLTVRNVQRLAEQKHLPVPNASQAFLSLHPHARVSVVVPSSSQLLTLGWSVLQVSRL